MVVVVVVVSCCCFVMMMMMIPHGVHCPRKRDCVVFVPRQEPVS